MEGTEKVNGTEGENGGIVTNGVHIQQTDRKRDRATRPEPKFGPVALSCPATASIFEQKRGGKSTVAVNASVPLPQVGLIVDCAIWARLTVSADGQRIDFDAALPSRMKAIDESAKQAFIDHVELAASKWAGYESAASAAEARLLGRDKTGKDGKAMQPRLASRKVVLAAK